MTGDVAPDAGPAFGFAVVTIGSAPVLAVVREDDVVPLSRLVDRPPADFAELLEVWDEVVAEVAAGWSTAGAGPTSYATGAVDFHVPGVAAPAVWCAGANYADHVAELGFADVGDRAFHFLVPPTALNRHRGTVHPPVHADMLDWEVELAVVIGRTARHVAPQDAADHIAGYTIANDLTVRGQRHPIFGVDWVAAKSADGTTPLGPTIVPRCFVTEPRDLELKLTVNCITRQRSSSARMLVGIEDQIAALSRVVTLRPGDVILTGSPAGTAAAHHGAYLTGGDVIEAEITGLGVLRTEIAR
ncbi:fumarylacetoacetate hydrolase family protein [Streptomyces sp. NPDC047043]|uniref:fumarylacetoacetate hydrolase family protein n=1 Tax=Streptomyces sp. NPDC047043 TaxID=3154497 RepID=UPI0033F34B48